jgi:hypothetical protein
MFSCKTEGYHIGHLKNTALRQGRQAANGLIIDPRRWIGWAYEQLSKWAVSCYSLDELVFMSVTNNEEIAL